MRTLSILPALLIVFGLSAVSAGAAENTKSQHKVLFVLSANEHGYWLPEVLTPYQILTDAGMSVDFASPDGGPGVQAGGDMMTEQEKRTLSQLTKTLARPLNLASINTKDYDALYVPGGAGPMFDLFNHPDVNRITATMYENNKPVSAACHGPAAFAAVRLSTGELMVSGKKLTAKSNAEEGDWAKSNYPFLLEDKFTLTNSQFSAAPPYEPWVVQDGNLLTGQNPASAGPLATALIKLIHSSAKTQTK